MVKNRTLISLVILLVVLAGTARFFSRLAELNPVQPAAQVKARASRIAKAIARKPVTPGARVIVVTNEFHWASIESPDYKTYIANLRAVGCPESTIRDIVLTDLMKFYAVRRGQSLTNGHDFKYWETDDQRKQTAEQEAAREQQFTKIDREIGAVVRELLGVNYDREINRYFVDVGREQTRLAFLSDEKREQVLALRDKFEGLQEAIYEQAGNGRLSATDYQKLKAVEEERRGELSNLLTPLEMEQYELATSATAERLRQELVGFNPSESEFRRLFQLFNQHDQKFAVADPDDAAMQQSKADDLSRVEVEVAQQLGPGRFADYQMSQNSDYRNFVLLAHRHQLPSAAALTAFQIKQTAMGERQRLFTQAGLSDEQRFQAMKAMRIETEKALRDTCGDKAFRDYQKRTESNWLTDFDRPPP